MIITICTAVAVDRAAEVSAAAIFLDGSGGRPRRSTRAVAGSNCLSYDARQEQKAELDAIEAERAKRKRAEEEEHKSAPAASSAAFSYALSSSSISSSSSSLLSSSS